MDPVQPRQEVVVTDVNMPFWSIVCLMVKWAFASIPALVILFLVGVVCSFAFTMIALSWRPLLSGRQASVTKSISERTEELKAERQRADLARREQEIRDHIAKKDEPRPAPPSESVSLGEVTYELKTEGQGTGRYTYSVGLTNNTPRSITGKLHVLVKNDAGFVVLDEVSDGVVILPGGPHTVTGELTSPVAPARLRSMSATFHTDE